MIEEKIEQRIIDRLRQKLEGIGITNCQYVSQLGPVDGVKSLEDSTADIIIVVKSSPRQYSTATIPTCQIDVSVTAMVRSDIDYNGMKYKDVTEQIMGLFQQWQRCLRDCHEDFTIADEFRCVGYQLGAGDFGLDQTTWVWNYQHTMSIFGVVLFADGGTPPCSEDTYSTTTNQ